MKSLKDCRFANCFTCLGNRILVKGKIKSSPENFHELLWELFKKLKPLVGIQGVTGINTHHFRAGFRSR